MKADASSMKTDAVEGETNEAQSTPPLLVPPPARPVVPSAPSTLEVIEPVKSAAPAATADPGGANQTHQAAGADPEEASLRVPQPISPPSEPLQYRAIGLLQGIFEPSEEQFNRGELITREGLRLDAVLLGQIMSLVKKYLDLSLPYLWVVYPRTRESEPMHVQLVGVWSPSGFGAESAEDEENQDDELAGQNSAALEASLSPLESLLPPLKDGFFSIRGQVIQQFVEEKSLFVKIQQASRKKADAPKAFKLKLMGDIPQKPMGYFWDFEVVRDGEQLKIDKATPISFIPIKKKKGPPRRGDREAQRPIKRSAPTISAPVGEKSDAKPETASTFSASESSKQTLPKK